MFQKATECKSCGKLMAFLRTGRGNLIPVDWESLNRIEKDDIINGNTRLFDHKRHTSHFATCPDANKYRREKK